MPVFIRTLALDTSVVSYRFPDNEHEATEQRWPWLKSPSSDGDLCRTCSSLNFSWLFNNALSAYEIRRDGLVAKLSDGICLGLYGHISSRSSCGFCQLIVQAFEQGADFETLDRYDSWHEQEVWVNNYFPDQFGHSLIPNASIDEHVTQLGMRLGSSNDSRTIVDLGSRAVVISQIFTAPRWQARGKGRAIEYNVEGLVQTLRDWVLPCTTQNTSADLTTRDDAAKLRLIDTRDHCIVGPLLRVRYVALSYTWGKVDPLVLLAKNESELRKNGALLFHKERLPTTILDAIRLCALLGERYLWVDSLCIMQDTIDKHTQIQQMDLIYQNAALCIVAAAGRDANAGLPGVSAPRAQRQRIINIGPHQLSNKLPSFGESIASTFWQSRGWCFQEELLSVRKLVFTADQTYLSCEHGTCAENIHDSIHDEVHRPVGKPTDDIPWLMSFAARSNWEIYHLAVAEYSNRSLSFEGDASNAFAGIAAVLSARLFLNSPFIMGIPICSLEVGLMWYPFTRLKRRSAGLIPSWSWAGWVGDVGYRLGLPERDFDRTISQIQWHFGTRDEVVTGIPPDSWPGWSDWQRVEDDKLDGFHYIHTKSDSDRWFAHPIAKQQWSSAMRNPLLKCTADVAQMTLTGEHTEFWSEEEEA
ncbi:hypothetical protein NX059_011953 [Plenodomus lindquistii]|nr:hypothetical protein NX059_011953 [Plenodomus lindquistii]